MTTSLPRRNSSVTWAPTRRAPGEAECIECQMNLSVLRMMRPLKGPCLQRR